MVATSTTVLVSPQLAGEWLATSRGNRRTYKPVVARYAREMAEDKWQLNGEAIVFDTDGHLVNGHHRLMACQLAGRAFKSFVVRGVEGKTFDTFDSGLKRSPSDVLELKGYKYSKELSAAAVLVWRHKNSRVSGTVSPSLQELDAILAQYPSLPHSVEVCMPARTIISVSVLAFVHCLGSQKDSDTADLFVSSLIDGVGLAVNSPVRLLREKCLQSRGRGVGRLPRVTLLAFVIKAYNYFAAELPLGTLKWQAGEVFPSFGVVDRDIRRIHNKRQAAANERENDATAAQP